MTVVTSYTLNAAAKTITLGTAYSAIALEQILIIKNLTRNIEIYTNENPRKRKMALNEDGIDISFDTGAITYIESDTMENTDKILIIISSGIDGGTA